MSSFRHPYALCLCVPTTQWPSKQPTQSHKQSNERIKLFHSSLLVDSLFTSLCFNFFSLSPDEPLFARCVNCVQRQRRFSRMNICKNGKRESHKIITAINMNMSMSDVCYRFFCCCCSSFLFLLTSSFIQKHRPVVVLPLLCAHFPQFSFSLFESFFPIAFEWRREHYEQSLMGPFTAIRYVVLPLLRSFGICAIVSLGTRTHASTQSNDVCVDGAPFNSLLLFINGATWPSRSAPSLQS